SWTTQRTPARINRRTMFDPMRPRPTMPSSTPFLRMRMSRAEPAALCCGSIKRVRGTHLSTRPCPLETEPGAHMTVKHEPAVVVASIPALTQRWVVHCAAAARAAQAARGRFTIAVPGGSVAERFLPPLAEGDIDWSLVDLCFCDERCVPPQSRDANAAA